MVKINFFKIVLASLVLLGTAGFWYFENLLLMRVFSLVLGLIALFLIYKEEYFFSALLAIFWASFHAVQVYGILFSFVYHSPIVLLQGLIFFFALFYLLKENIFTSLFFVFIILEIFYLLTFWPINPILKSGFLVLVLNLFYGFMREPSFKKISLSLILLGLLLTQMGWRYVV